jgi:hypothetical protein
MVSEFAAGVKNRAEIGSGVALAQVLSIVWRIISNGVKRHHFLVLGLTVREPLSGAQIRALRAHIASN